MSDSKYCYPGTEILINKLNIRDKKELFEAEKELTLIRLKELQREPVQGDFDFNHLMDCSEIKNYKSDLVNDLKDALIEARTNEEWRVGYMRALGLENELLRKGREEGRESERDHSLKLFIKRLKKLGIEEADLIFTVMEDYGLDKDTAEQKVRAI